MVAIPIPLPPPPVPASSPTWPEGIPGIDEPIRIIGRGAVETWNDIYDFVSTTWAGGGSIVDFLSDETVQVVFPVIEGFVGQAIKGVGSVINDLTQYTVVGNWIADNIMGQAFDWIRQINEVFGGAIVATIGALEGVIDGWLPMLYDAILGIPGWVEGYVHDLAIDIETWAVGHILNPVLDELQQTEAAIRADVFSLVDAVAGTLGDMITAVDTDLLARLGLVAGVAAAALTFVEGCGKSMCDLFGPATDIGKLFKAFELAGILSLLMEIGDMTEADVVARLRELAGDVSGVVNTFDDVFVGGGGSLVDFGKALL